MVYYGYETVYINLFAIKIMSNKEELMGRAFNIKYALLAKVLKNTWKKIYLEKVAALCVMYTSILLNLKDKKIYAPNESEYW